MGYRRTTSTRNSVASAFLTTVVLCLTVACGPNEPKTNHIQPASPKEGGQDNGGGTLVSSDELQVREALQQAIRVASDCDDSNFIYNIEIGGAWKDANLEQIYQRVIFPGNSHLFTGKIQHLAYDRLCSYFPKSEILIKDSGACEANDNRHADASVSKHEIGATICISLDNLKRVPPSHLFGEVLSLLVHEAAHLVGLREQEAVRLQKLFSFQLQKVNAFYDKAIVYDTFIRQIEEARGRVNAALDFAKHSDRLEATSFTSSIKDAMKAISSGLPDYDEQRMFQVAVANNHTAYTTKVYPALVRARYALLIAYPETFTGTVKEQIDESNNPGLKVLAERPLLGSTPVKLAKILDFLDKAQAGVEEAFGPTQKQ